MYDLHSWGGGKRKVETHPTVSQNVDGSHILRKNPFDWWGTLL